jgi:transposase
MDSTSKIFKEYVKKYGEPDKMRLQRRGVKLTKNSPYVKNVIKSVEEVGVRETARRFGKERKTIRNVLHRFRKDLIKDINVKGEETSAKKSKIKAKEDIKISQKKAGPKTTKQTKEVISKIAEYNNPYKKMSAKNLAKDKNFLKRLRMHIDINTGAITYDGYTKARPRKGKVFSDLELAEHAIKKAKAGELFTADHITPKSLQKQNVGYPRNLQPVTYIENSEFDNARKYVLNKPEGDTSAIDKYLTKNNQTLRFPDQKIKLGYKEVIEYSPTKGTHTLIDKPGKPSMLKNIFKGVSPVLKAAKPVLKSLPVIGTGIGLYDVNKAVEAGITHPSDLLAAYNVSADVAAKNKAMREDESGQLLLEEMSRLPAIDNPFAAASGGRVPLQGGGGIKNRFNRWLNNPTVKNVIAAELGLEGLLQLYSLLGMPIMAEGGRVGYEGGGITTLHPRRPEALPPKSGPMPQGGGLSSMFNRAREW